MTLDLSTPQLPTFQDEAMYKEKPKGVSGIWVNKGIRNVAQGGARRGTRRKRSKHQKENGELTLNRDADEEVASDDEEESLMQDDQDDGNDMEIDESLVVKETTSPAASNPKIERPSKVQILDLHHKTPVVSFGEEVFTLEWTKNIGTEFLFTEYDDQKPLPIVRHLSEGVDLIAATSIRLMPTPVILEPKFGQTHSRMAGRGRNEESDVIQIDAISKRDQTDFLSRLAEIKRIHSERDEISMTTRKPARDPKAALRADFETRRSKERKGLSKLILAGKDTIEVEKAQERLAAIDEESKRNQPAIEKAYGHRVRKGRAGTNSNPTFARNLHKRSPLPSMDRLGSISKAQTPQSLGP